MNSYITRIPMRAKVCCFFMVLAWSSIFSESMHLTEENADKNGMHVSGSFLYWMPQQDNMSLGVVNDATGTLDLVKGYDQSFDYEFKPGFSVELRKYFREGEWSVSAEYTWFHTKESVDVSLDTSDTLVSLLPSWQIPSFSNPQYHQGAETWYLDMDLVDLIFAREYHIGNRLTYTPSFGLRAAWIGQKIDVSYENTNPSFAFIWPTTTIMNRSDSWAIGPRIGCETLFELGHGVRLIGEGAYDLLYTEYSLKSTQTSEVTTANQYTVSASNVGSVRSHVSLEAGIGWGTCFSEGHYALSINALYGFQAFFDQNMFWKSLDTQAPGVSTLPNGNLYIQGLTLQAAFEF